MSYRHSSYRKMSKAVVKANQATAVGEKPDLARHEMCRVLHWSNRPALPKPATWGKKRPRRWPEGATCTDCAPDGVCEQGCVDEPRNPKARLRSA